MRVQLAFQIDELPIGYRLGVLSVIKEMIKNGSTAYYEQIFETGKHQIKPFGYSTYIKNLKIDGNKIFGDELIVTVSSSSYEWMMHLINGSHKKKDYQYKNYRFYLKSKRLLPKVNISDPVVTFSTKSPILLERKEKGPVLSTDSLFEKEFQYISGLIIEGLANRKPYAPIRVLKAAMTKQVIKENLHQSEDRFIYLTANKGIIQLEGHPDDLQVLYDNGVSFRRSLGLGLLDVEEVKSKSWKR
ncbi:MAG: CRISPR-associated endoribonuclease Cas6 [Bacillaceae bacterium]